jgi:hypothetical protein
MKLVKKGKKKITIKMSIEDAELLEDYIGVHNQLSAAQIYKDSWLSDDDVEDIANQEIVQKIDDMLDRLYNVVWLSLAAEVTVNDEQYM